MKSFDCTLLSLLLLPAFCSLAPGSARAQAPAAHPVLSADPAPPPATPPPGPSSSPAVNLVTIDPNNYIIGPQDSISINVFEEDKFTEPATVRPDGMITLPLVGDIPAAGRTPMQLASDIKGLLKKFVADPAVTVSVLGVNSRYVTFVGEIGRQGNLPITPGMTILQAIANMGGLSAYANPKKIYIQRGPQGKQQIIHFDYKKAVKTGNMQGVTLVPGDTIVVP